jgi:hypothetical protein
MQKNTHENSIHSKLQCIFPLFSIPSMFSVNIFIIFIKAINISYEEVFVHKLTYTVMR